MIKDHRTKMEVGDVDRVLDGDLQPFIRAYLLARRAEKQPMTVKPGKPKAVKLRAAVLARICVC